MNPTNPKVKNAPPMISTGLSLRRSLLGGFCGCSMIADYTRAARKAAFLDRWKGSPNLMTRLSPIELMRNPILSFCIIMFTAPSLFANGIIKSEFIYENAPFPQGHASTIEETKEGLVAAWFGGTREKNPDVGIWLSRHDGKNWSEPVEVANGVQSPEKRFPCWNPDLFHPKSGPLIIF